MEIGIFFKILTSGTKILLIPPIIIGNKLVFAPQCTLIVNDSILPSTIVYRTENKVSTISFKDEDDNKVI